MLEFAKRRADDGAAAILLGAIAGAAGTVAMTAAMRRIQARLPQDDRYPLPPREIVESGLRKAGAEAPEGSMRSASVAAHFAYGAACGALYSALTHKGSLRSGSAYGLLVWAASYFGWLPAAGLLRPAHTHPLSRNLLMTAAHAVWGAATAGVLNELRAARKTAFGDGPLKDAEGA